MTIQKRFTKRADDIEETLNLVKFIANIESHRNLPITFGEGSELYVSQEMQCALKAQFLVVLYNIVESTVCDCLILFTILLLMIISLSQTCQTKCGICGKNI